MPGEYFREFSFSFRVSVRLEVINFSSEDPAYPHYEKLFGLLGVLTRWSFHPLNQDGGSVDFDFESVEVFRLMALFFRGWYSIGTDHGWAWYEVFANVDGRGLSANMEGSIKDGYW